jgi:hypothetical protein
MSVEVTEWTLCNFPRRTYALYTYYNPARSPYAFTYIYKVTPAKAVSMQKAGRKGKATTEAILVEKQRF